MAFSRRDVHSYRSDEKLGHQLLSPEERIRMLKPYLPSPPPRPSQRRDSAAPERTPRIGVRRLLKKQLHALLFIIIHTFFSLWIKIRHAYHAVASRVDNVYNHHHRTPELIRSDVEGLGKLPRHLSVILTLEDDRKGGAGLDKLVANAADIAAWCASAGIPQLSIYEKTGILKNHLDKTHRVVSQNLASYFGSGFPLLTVGAPHMPPIESSRSVRINGTCSERLSILLLSAEDGRDSMVDLTKTLAEMSQRSKISSADISIELVDAELSESIMDEPDLLLLFGPHVDLAGYPPWQVRLTEIFHVQDNQGVGYQVFRRGLAKFAKAQMRLGR